jgi:hypothetical protein
MRSGSLVFFRAAEKKMALVTKQFIHDNARELGVATLVIQVAKFDDGQPYHVTPYVASPRLK